MKFQGVTLTLVVLGMAAPGSCKPGSPVQPATRTQTTGGPTVGPSPTGTPAASATATPTSTPTGTVVTPTASGSPLPRGEIPSDAHVIFVSSTGRVPRSDEMAYTDRWCQELAAVAKWPNAERFVALLARHDTRRASDLVVAVPGPVYESGGSVVASSFADLFAKPLLAPVAKNEFGTFLDPEATTDTFSDASPRYVYTGFKKTGEPMALPSTSTGRANCANWQLTSGRSAGGKLGDLSRWFGAEDLVPGGVSGCTEAHPIYCIRSGTR